MDHTVVISLGAFGTHTVHHGGGYAARAPAHRPRPLGGYAAHTPTDAPYGTSDSLHGEQDPHEDYANVYATR